ncbi:MAG: hypothetical protein EI684_04900 [Candidatus Viridilinea halotolerans]|uniref:Uncharacterized protein n=1 Tax=Candidatus Viridilinea halotolerans TaxID=2491704 RepID=A0A426U5Y8_9CHLR|nr:MAG: hypothetical protein EI684_04900 [Candidatus Viridilinea halotolerans]
MTVQIWKVSPKYDSSKLDNDTIADRIDVYADRIQGWLIDCGHILNQHEHAGFGVLNMAFSYFEGYSSFLRGEDSEKQGKTFFEEAIYSVIPDLQQFSEKTRSEIVKILWKDGRNGLFHIGMSRRRIALLDGSHVFACSLDEQQRVVAVFINRHGIIKAIEDHHHRYVERLRDPNEIDLRNNFERAWQILHSL